MAISQSSIAEPTNNIAPKALGDKYEGGKLMSPRQRDQVFLMCQVVGYPSPIFRLVSVVYKSEKQIKIAVVTSEVGTFVKVYL